MPETLGEAKEEELRLGRELIQIPAQEDTLMRILASEGLPSGTNTGDIIRWNAATGAWESKAEPFSFKQIILTPLSSPLSDVEGGIYYKKTDNGVYVAVE